MLSWEMTLKEYRDRLKDDADYQEYCRNVYRSAAYGDTNAIHFAMAFLLGGSGQVKNSVQKVYIDQVCPGNTPGAGPWNAGVANFLDKTRTNSELNGLFKGFSPDTTIDAAFDALKHKRDEAGTPLMTDEQITHLKDMLRQLLQSTVKDDVVDLIRHGKCHQIIFTGAPGTGKTYIARKIAEEACTCTRPWGGRLQTGEKNRSECYTLVQFHPSMDYTDFVEGLRPVMKDGTMVFARVDGVFKHFCRRVVTEGDPEKLYFFIIDEINRANLSKVFGELMYGLEKDKRGEQHRIRTQYHNLPTCDIRTKTDLAPADDVFYDGFYLPENVVVLGTMNDIDRSVDSMDYALRRRFEWKEFLVTETSLKLAFMSGNYGEAIKDNAEELARRIDALNRYLGTQGREFGLNRHYYIAQGQFAHLPEHKQTLPEILRYVWDYRIESLLREYLRGGDEAEIEAFIGSGTPVQKGREPADSARTALFGKTDAPKPPAKPAAKDASAQSQE